jgi:mannose-6-phosphate isomerase-like protein (cupin superfamily)
MRRVICDVNDKGESFVASDEEIPDSGHLWTSDPATTQAWIDSIDPETAFKLVQPPPRGVYWVLAQLPPGHGMAPAKSDHEGMDERGFHVTRTIDFIYVLEGEIILELTLDSVELNKGDIVVQQATPHAWKNPTDHPVRFIDVVVSGVKE